MEFDFDRIAEKIGNHAYAFLGAGSGRKVFDLGGKYAVKAARNKKGIAQNKTEYELFTSGVPDFFARVIAVSDGFEFLIMEKAEKLADFSVVLKHFNVKNQRELFRLEAFRRIPRSYGLLPDDLVRKDSWGLINGKPVVVDYGFTLQVRRKYYSPF